jgi:hypothetical protein
VAAPKKVDWGVIEPDWRAGVLSVQQLATNYTEKTGVSVTKAAVSKHFTKLGIPRNLKERIINKAESMVAAAMVSGKVDAETLASEADIINVNALGVAEVMMSHRQAAAQTSEIGRILKNDLLAMVSNRKLMEQLGEIMASPDESGADKQNEVYRKVISFPGLVDSYKKLVDAEEKANANARRSWNIRDDDTPEGDNKSAPTVVIQIAGQSIDVKALGWT